MILTGPSLMHRNTCATLLRAGVDVAGIVICDRRRVSDRWNHLRRWAARYGWQRAASQILARFLYNLTVGRRDGRWLRDLVDDTANQATITASGVPVVYTTSYSAPETRDSICSWAPEFLVVHSPYIVGRKVRALAAVSTIGGHPGITPWYRGSYSAFWALTHERPEMVGWTVFELDEGIDTGPILAQGRLVAESGDSHMLLTFRGMIAEARAQADLILRYASGQDLQATPVTTVDDSTYFGPPTLSDLLRHFRVRKDDARR